jgi:hypothetical protein
MMADVTEPEVEVARPAESLADPAHIVVIKPSGRWYCSCGDFCAIPNQGADAEDHRARYIREGTVVFFDLRTPPPTSGETYMNSSGALDLSSPSAFSVTWRSGSAAVRHPAEAIVAQIVEATVIHPGDKLIVRAPGANLKQVDWLIHYLTRSLGDGLRLAVLGGDIELVLVRNA